MGKKSYFLPALSEFFSSYLPETRGASSNTIRSYKQAFRLLLEYIHAIHGLLPEKVEFKHLEKGTVESWLNWLCAERNCTAGTRNHRLSAVAAFAKFSLHRDFGGALSFCAEVGRIPKKRDAKRNDAVYFTKSEMAILLRLPDSDSKNGRRNKVLLSTLYASGARAQELCDITVGDIRLEDVSTITLRGKGGKARTVVIPEQCAALLRTHLDRNRLKGSDSLRHVFSSQTHEHMTISCIEAIVKKYVSEAKKLRPDIFREHYTPHSFRHSIAMHMLESEIPLPVIKTFLGHVSIASTLIYASANYELMNKYLRDKDPYAEQTAIAEQPNSSFIPQFLK
ncbi:MAG: site-specific integrase [Clostridiales Family XIII bacterium]|jgi:site-specific recombinase XerD|nr:site-specific integrase [Clostridiales Family XIII bacterium]